MVVIKTVSPTQTIVSKTTNKELVKRELTLVDTSTRSVQMTIWNDEVMK